MTTKRKRKKHALNPFIIISFIIIGLLVVVLSIANVSLNDNLKTTIMSTGEPICIDGGSAPECAPPQAFLTVSNDGIGEYTKEDYETITRSGIIAKAKEAAVINAYAGLDAKCIEESNGLRKDPLIDLCQKAQDEGYCGTGCQQDPDSVSKYQPPAKKLNDCTYNMLVEPTDTYAKYRATCSGECKYKLECEPGSDDPVSEQQPDVICGPSEPPCEIEAEGVIETTTSARATETVTIAQVSAKKAELEELAKTRARNKIDASCKSKLIRSATYVDPDPMSIACPDNNGCIKGCDPNGRPTYDPPPTQPDCNTSSTTQQALYDVEIKATAVCTAYCVYKQKCEDSNAQFDPNM